MTKKQKPQNKAEEKPDSKQSLDTIFLDLGFPPEEAKLLSEKVQRYFERSDHLKAQMMKEIAAFVTEQKFSKKDAAAFFEVKKKRMSKVLKGKAMDASFNELLEMLLQADKDVEIVVK